MAEPRLIKWFVSRDTGSSSKTMAAWLGAGILPDWPDHPYDPADLGRCLRLLEIMPEWKSRVGEMAPVSPTWAALVERWDEITRCMMDEVGIDWSKGLRSPKTYDLMAEIRKGTHDA